jgi:hypothetical protein
MSLRMTDEQLADFKMRCEKWEKPNNIKTHLIDTSAPVAVERARKNKYGNKRTELDGITFDSMKEAGRYGELKLLQAAGEISDLKIKHRYLLKVNGIRVCEYEDDFSYLERGKRIVEDTKGMRTDLYKLKKKLMRACLGIEIRET